jgi:Tfp pilus assembly protein PilX
VNRVILAVGGFAAANLVALAGVIGLAWHRGWLAQERLTAALRGETEAQSAHEAPVAEAREKKPKAEPTIEEREEAWAVR